MELEDEVKNILDSLFERAKTPKEINELRMIIDEYSDEGYFVLDYVHRYNKLVQKMSKQQS